MATFLFCDLVGSTSVLTRLGHDDGEGLRRAGFGALRGALARHGGREVKSTGDGLMTVFASVSDASLCAVDMQQSLARLSRREPAVALRVGISHGDASEEDDDYYGTTVVEAARLCETAVGGQILATEVVALLVRNRAEHRFSEARSYSLKGLGEVDAVEMLWEPLADVPDLPQFLSARPGAFFVGRGAELGQLSNAWKEASAGALRAVLIGGEPGVGKTSLAAELAQRVHREPAMVLFGRCDEGMRVPYQPFVEALSFYIDHVDTETLEALDGRAARELTRLFPALADRRPNLPAPTAADPETERYLLYEAVRSLLTVASAAAPVLVVLDDLHWAAQPTLLLLRHLLRSDSNSKLLIIGTYRDTELDRAHPLTELLADLRRIPHVDRLAVAGLDEPSVAAFVGAASGGSDLGPTATGLVSALWAQTDGNPFFVGAVLAHLVELGIISETNGQWRAEREVALADVGLPDGVREVLGRRLTRLTDVSQEWLAVAAVLGASFPVDLLQKVTGARADELVRGLEDAAAAGLVVETNRGFAFAHALVRQALLAGMSNARRALLHRRIGEALEAVGDPDAHVEALADHFANAEGETAKAVDYALAAGRKALNRLAGEEALAQFDRALRLIDSSATPDRTRRCNLLLAIAEARGTQATTMRAAFEAAMAAADDARAAGSVVGLVAAAGIASSYTALEVDYSRVEALCEEALAKTATETNSLRADAMASLAWHRFVVRGRDADVIALAREAVELARASESVDTIVQTVLQWARILVGSEFVDERIVATTEVIAIADDLAYAGLRNEALIIRAAAHLEKGDRSAFEADLASTDVGSGLANALHGGNRSPHRVLVVYLAAADVLKALIDGQLERAESLAGTILASQPFGRQDFTVAMYMAQMLMIRREQGRLAELLPTLEAASDSIGEFPALRAAVALALVDTGNHDAARAIVTELIADDAAVLLRDTSWTAALCGLAEVCARTGDAAAADVVYRLLAPHRGTFVLVRWGVACIGAADRFLAMLATTMGCFEDAEKHYEAALQIEEGIGAAPSLARTRMWMAKMLVTRADVGDDQRATALLADASVDATRYGMNALLAEIAGIH